MTTPNRTLLRAAVAAAIEPALQALDAETTWLVEIGRFDNIPDDRLPMACVYLLGEQTEILGKGQPRHRRHACSVQIDLYVAAASASDVETLLDQAAAAVDQAMTVDDKLTASGIEVRDVRPGDAGDTYEVATSGKRYYGVCDSVWDITYETTVAGP